MKPYPTDSLVGFGCRKLLLRIGFEVWSNLDSQNLIGLFAHSILPMNYLFETEQKTHNDVFQTGELYSVLLFSLKTKKIQAGGKQQVPYKCKCSICNLEVCIFFLSKKREGGLQEIFMCSSSVKISSSQLSVSCKRQGQSLSRGSDIFFPANETSPQG